MTDEYLNPNASFLRLLKEYNQYGSLVIAFDFDNTVYDFHGKGNYYDQVIELIRELKEIGCYMICFTANPDFNFVTQYLNKLNIPFDSINENPPFFKSEERKIYFNALLDDRAGLQQVYAELNLLITIIKQNKNENN
jgi:hydroxymethylpyrimidine pyrophosphatase-like HAD family hydrolase